MKKLIFIESGSISGTKKNILFDGLSNNSNVEISQEGNKYALKYHKPSNRIDEILSQI